MSSFYVNDDGDLYSALPGLEWGAVYEWEQDPVSGKRRPTDRQEVADDGRRLWARQVLMVEDRFGRQEAALHEIRKWSVAKPDTVDPGKFSVGGL